MLANQRLPNGGIVEPCVYCGDREGTEDDHAVGRLFFPKPKPEDLITVPACDACNRGISKDEEYVRAVLLTLMDTENMPAAERLRGRELRRSFEREEGKGLANLILSSVEWVNVHTPSGTALPDKVPIIGADVDRMYRVLIKIVKGLYYHWKGERLPDDYEVLVYLAGLGEPFQDVLPQAIRFVAKHEVLHKIGDGSSFVYWVREGDELPDQSYWFMSFYRAVPILAATRRKKHPPRSCVVT